MSAGHATPPRRDPASADLLFRNGTVLTVDARFGTARAVAVSGGVITAVGAEREVLPLAGPGTRVIDLEGGALLPGINDSHLHASMLGAYAPAYWMDAMTDGGAPATPRTLRTEEDRRSALRRAWDILIPLGITSYTEPGLGPGADHQHGGSCGAAVLETYRRMAAESALPLRVNVLALYGELDGDCDPDAVVAATAELSRDASAPDRRLRLAGLKIFADGIPPAHSAWLLEEYLGGGSGQMLIPGAGDTERVRALERMIDVAHARGLQVGVHATGGATIAATVAAFAKAAERHGDRDLRHYVIHGDLASAETLELMARHGFGLNTQPGIYTATAAMLAMAIGERRAERAFALRSALDLGVPVSLSSDAPVMAPDWRRGIVAAVTRREESGAVRGEDQRLDLAEAIRAYTIVPAHQDHAERWKGSIEVGKVADLCVLDANPFEVAPEDIARLQIRLTVIGGSIAYEPGL